MIKSFGYYHIAQKAEIIKSLSDQKTVFLSNADLSAEKNKIKGKVFSPQEFYEYLIRKSPGIEKVKTLSHNAAIYIIRAVTKSLFTDCRELYTLIKSDLFSRELYELFGIFIENRISYNFLKDVLNKIQLVNTDKIRLEKVFLAYETYLETAKSLGYTDKRALPEIAEKNIKNFPEYLSTVQSKFKYIIIDEPQSFSEHEINFLQLICKDLYLIHNNFEYLSEADGNIRPENPNEENEFLKLAKLFASKYLGYNYDEKPGKNSKISYKKFPDLKDEIEYISNDILKKTTAKTHDYKDFEILVRNNYTKKLVENIFTIKNIPVNTVFEDQEFRSFAIKLSRYFIICDNLKSLKANNIYENDSSKFRITTKYKLNSIFNEINLNFENIISETLDNQFIKDKFLDIQISKNNFSLINTVKNNVDILNNKDSKKLLEEMKKIEKFFELYSQGEIVGATVFAAKHIKENSKNFKYSLAKLITRIKVLSDLSFSLKAHSPEINSILEVINLPVKNEAGLENAVKVNRPENSFQHQTKTVYLIDLCEKNIPKQQSKIQFISENADEKVSAEIKKSFKNFERIISTPNSALANEAKLFARNILRAKEEIIFSTHMYEEKKPILPSPFFQFLSSLDKENVVENISSEQSAEISTVTQQKLPVIKTDKTVIDENEVIKLNVSAISDYQLCPRKFYFAHLMKLKSSGTFAATYGSIVHSILENFNKNYLDEYSANTLKSLADKLFDSQNFPEIAANAGFKQLDIDRITVTDPLSLAEMKENFLGAIKELDRNGFFNTIPDEVICEKTFEFTCDKIPNIVFDGRIDAIYKFKDKYLIVDFKTGKNKPELNYLVSENGVNFNTKTGAIPANPQKYQKEYEYQIPIYYLATQHSDNLKEFKNIINEYSLLYIRPKNQNDGFFKDTIPTEQLKEYETRIIDNLNETIINKIRDKKFFEPDFNEFSCENCSFKILCDSKEGSLDDD